MSEQTGTIGPNDCFVTDNVMSSSRNLIAGVPLTPISFADLCELIEMAVLHDRIVMTVPNFQDSALQVLLDAGIVTSTMFKDATPSDEASAQLVSRIYEQCLRTLKEGGVFGRGVMDVIDTAESDDERLERTLLRIRIGELLLSVDHGRRTVAPDAQEEIDKLRCLYQVFKDYADAVFDAAQHFHICAYAGTSEIAYSIQRTVRSTPRSLYDELRKLHKDRVDRFLVLAGYTAYNIPPFALIVLSRCKRRDDIVPKILRARDEFSNFRETCTIHSARIRDAVQGGSLEDIINLNNDRDRAIEILTKKVKASTKDSRFVYRLWDVVKAASPRGIAENVLDRLKTYDIERQHLQTVNGLMDVWKKLGKASSYEAVLRSNLFSNEFSPGDFAAFNDYLAHVKQYLPVDKSP